METTYNTTQESSWRTVGARLTTKQFNRLGHIAWYGPQDIKASDSTLIELGWLELYDGDSTAVDITDFAKAYRCADMYIPNEMLANALKFRALQTGPKYAF